MVIISIFADVCGYELESAESKRVRLGDGSPLVSCVLTELSCVPPATVSFVLCAIFF